MHAIAALISVVAILGLTAPVAATQSDDTKTIDPARADQLDREASALYGNPDQWKKASSLHEEAAELRAPEDPRLLIDLEIAASLAAHVSDFDRAERLMSELADAAAAVGDVERAAHSYLTAALMAVKTDDGRHAQTWVEKARLLSFSPLLSDEAAGGIRSRLLEAGASRVASR
jgi:hypothetical protein